MLFRHKEFLTKMVSLHLLQKSPQRIQYIFAAKFHKGAEIETDTPASFADDELEEEIKPLNFFNKSRLLPAHRKMLLEARPYDEPESWVHLTEKYQRKMFGRYGAASKIDPRICFPTKKSIEKQREYERVAFPFALQQMIDRNVQEKESRRAAILKRDEDIGRKLEKLEQWKKELKLKIAKKETESNIAKERKERLVEEVRRHFGFKIDPRDEKFKELLEQKEREDRKKQKEAKRKIKEDKLMAKLVEINANK